MGLAAAAKAVREEAGRRREHVPKLAEGDVAGRRRRQAGVQQGQQYASLTDIITQGWSGKTTRQYKHYKGLKKENLRDNMTNIELALNTLAEASVTEIS